MLLVFTYCRFNSSSVAVDSFKPFVTYLSTVLQRLSVIIHCWEVKYNYLGVANDLKRLANGDLSGTVNSFCLGEP